jgi:hypothetical protein
MGYLVSLKTMLVDALRTTFDVSYPEVDFRSVLCSIEYPVDPQSYPSVYVDYDDDDPLIRAGIDHHEFLNVGTNLEPALVPYTRWRFKGTVTFTMVALSSLERDRLYDEVVRVLAFGDENTVTSRFRTYIENNEFIAANMNFDTIVPRGNAAAPGTPWGTDEIIYERGVNVEILGEFVTNRTTGALVPLKAIELLSAQELIRDSDLVPFPGPDDAGTNPWL